MKKKSILLIFAGLTLGVSGTLAAAYSFSDVPTDHWAANAVEWAKGNALVQGYTDGTFQGDRNVSRYEMVQILANYDENNRNIITSLQKDIKDLNEQVSELNQNDGVLNIEDELTEASVDLNGDGVPETIKITFDKDQYGTLQAYTLKINDQEIKKDEWNLQGYFRIADIDKNDNHLEILVGAEGPSNDYTTDFYAFDGNDVINMGQTQGVYKYYDTKKMDFPGEGTFTTQTRGLILQTWSYEDEYGLNENHTLKHLPKDLYDMETSVTMLKDLPLQKSSDDAAIVTTLKTGDKATLISTDNKEWVLAKDKNGVEGWFKVNELIYVLISGNKFLSTEVFDGLLMAD